MLKKPAFHIFAVSDATGGLAHNLAVAASRQFEDVKVRIVRHRNVTNAQEIKDIVAKAKEAQGVILFTMVSQELRRTVLAETKEANVVAMDLMGPVLDIMSNYFHKLPSTEPGLQYRKTHDYYRRTEALEFSVRHDEGLGLQTIDQADIVLLGMSRASKTPIAIYLAYLGYRCANIPVVTGEKLPTALEKVDPKRIVGLLADPQRFALRRSTRLKNLGRPADEEYAQLDHIEAELAYAKELYSSMKGIHQVDLTGKGIEEIAGEIIELVKKKPL